ncbi:MULTISPECIES: hypothetical protein [Luteibacter]|uniref:hypothetical protein n=1 Tax=Luteibacter TaxID=242605 RepID=UPI00056D6FB5|nr:MULTISPECIES: hypothetical protein [unclassified Luteibacter]
MSIVVITAPRHGPTNATCAEHAMWRLWERAQASGVDLLWRPCSDFPELTDHIGRSASDHADLVLIDVDANDVPDGDVAQLRDALAALPVPYIEVHDDSDASDASELVPGHPCLASVVVPGDTMASYDMALAIGLRYLSNEPRLAA